MPVSFTDKFEHADTYLFEIEGNGNDLPFFFKHVSECQTIPHRHTYLQLVYILKGQLTHVSGSHINELRCGDLLLMPPYLPHYFVSGADRPFELAEFEFMAYFLDPRLAGDAPYDEVDALAWLAPYTDGHGFPLASLSGQLRYEAERVLEEVAQEYKTREAGYEVIVRAMACKLLTILRRALTQQSEPANPELIYERHREVLAHSLQFIRENYTRDITVQDAAAVAIMSPSYYRHYFKLLTKKTFTEYLNSLRVAHAINLIRQNPRQKIVDICYATGFNNISHFNRTFLKITGVTPKAFRGRMSEDTLDLTNLI